MLSGSYCKSPEMPPCLVGVILGTGMNGAYVQPDAKHFGYQGVVMNTELGGFNKDLPENDIDMEVGNNPLHHGMALNRLISIQLLVVDNVSKKCAVACTFQNSCVSYFFVCSKMLLLPRHGKAGNGMIQICAYKD